MPQITIVNNTDTNELVRVAIYKKPVLQPALSTIAWQVVTPQTGDPKVVPVPESYEVYAEYSLDPNNPDPASPNATTDPTNTVSFNQPTARFQIVSVTSQDRRSTGAYIHQVLTGLVANEVRLENNISIGALSHIQKDGVDILAPQVLLPGGVRIEDVRSTLYLAVVGQFVLQGSQIVDEGTQMTETPILEGGTAVVTGSMWKGYSITVSAS